MKSHKIGVAFKTTELSRIEFLLSEYDNDGGSLSIKYIPASGAKKKTINLNISIEDVSNMCLAIAAMLRLHGKHFPKSISNSYNKEQFDFISKNSMSANLDKDC